MQRLALEQLSGRTAIRIALRIILKLVIGKYVSVCYRPLVVRFPQVRHMGFDPLIMTSKKVVDGAVLAVCHYGVSLYSGCCLMLLQKRQHQVGFVDIAGGGIGCGNDFILSINGPMHLIRELRLAAVDDGRIRIGAGDVAAVLLLVVPGRIRAFVAVLPDGLPASCSSCATGASGLSCR